MELLLPIVLLLPPGWQMDVPGAQIPAEGREGLGNALPDSHSACSVQGGIGWVGSGLVFPRDELIQLQSEVFLKSLPEYLPII